MAASNLTPVERYNERFSVYLLQLSYSHLTRPCDNPHVMFKELRTVKPHGVSYNEFEKHVGHRYRKECYCVMCTSVTKGEVIGILPEPVVIAQVKRIPFTKPISPLPEQPKPRVIVTIQLV